MNISSEANLCFMCFKTAAATRVKFKMNFEIKTSLFFIVWLALDYNYVAYIFLDD